MLKCLGEHTSNCNSIHLTENTYTNDIEGFFSVKKRILLTVILELKRFNGEKQKKNAVA